MTTREHRPRIRYKSFHLTTGRVWPLRSGVVLLFMLSLSGCPGPAGPSPTLSDISPNQDYDRPATIEPSTAGVIIGLAGGYDTLWAINPNGGLWRSYPRSGSGWAHPVIYPWEAVWGVNAGELVAAIAADNREHVAIGEHDGNAIHAEDNQAGVWETWQAGVPWVDYLDPRSHSGCSSQAIAGLVFTTRHSSALIAATACGIAVKTGKGQPWQFPSSPFGAQPVTAVVTSETKVWARDAAGRLAVSSDEGQTWKLATNKPLPAGTNFSSQRGDAYSLGAFDSGAFMSCLGDDNGKLNGKRNNYSQLLIYDVASDSWTLQKRIFDPADNPTNDPSLGALNGTGLGGRRFIRSFVLGDQGQVGYDLQLYFCDAQEVYKAIRQNTDHTFGWIKVVATWAAETESKQAGFQNVIHNDIWDFLTDGRGAWVACDGGVFENKFDGRGWVTRNDGLHTHNIHDLFTPHPALHLAYVTSDNDAWMRIAAGKWRSNYLLGDANWVAGDAGAQPPYAVLARNLTEAFLTGFDINLPGVGVPELTITLNNDMSLMARTSFIMVQTMKGEPAPASPLDAFMLAKMPLQYKDANDRLFTALDNKQPFAVLRNKDFLHTPDINTSRGSGWAIAADNLPANPQGLWVSGGHANPTLYLLARDNTGFNLFRGDGKLPTSWTKLPIRGADQPTLIVNRASESGPVFVNPYQPSLYVLTSAGVRFSTDAGNSWNDDTELTNLITSDGTFPLVDNFDGGNTANTSFPQHVNAMGTLSAMAFDHEDPNQVLAASPFTGAFYNAGDSRGWHRLRPFLGTHAAISAVGIDGGTAYIATEGRGLLRLDDISRVP